MSFGGGGGTDDRYLAYQESKAQQQASDQAAAQQQAAQIAAINAQASAQQQGYFNEIYMAQQRAAQAAQQDVLYKQLAIQEKSQKLQEQQYADAKKLQEEQIAEMKRGAQVAKPVDAGAILARERQRGKAGAAGTLLTGPTGVQQIPLGRKTLLGA